MFVDDTPVHILIHVASHGHHLVERNAIMTHTGRVNQHLIFLDVTPEDGYLSHPTGRKQTWTDGPIGNRTEVNHRGTIRSQAHNQHLTQDGGLRSHGRLTHVFGEFFIHQRKLLAHNLTGEINIGIPIEFHPNHGETIGRG